MNTSQATFEQSRASLLHPASLIDALNLKPGMIVADFGCGGGHFTFMIAKRVGEEGKVYAIDVQAVPLEMIKERAQAERITNVQVIRANLEIPGSSTISDATVDLVLIANVLFQSPKKEAIIQEAKRILKPNGLLILIEWRKGAGGFGPPDELRMDENAIRTLVQQQGLQPGNDIHIGQFHHIMTFTP